MANPPRTGWSWLSINTQVVDILMIHDMGDSDSEISEIKALVEIGYPSA